MLIIQIGKVGIDVKREIRSMLSVARRAMTYNIAVRFTFAQLFFWLFVAHLRGEPFIEAAFPDGRAAFMIHFYTGGISS